jgi:hypothetical protein
MPETESRLAALERSNERIITLLEHLNEKMEDRIEHTDTWRERTDLILMGDGNGRAGHNVKIDRLERTLKAQMWFIRALGGGIIALALKAIADLL